MTSTVLVRAAAQPAAAISEINGFERLPQNCVLFKRTDTKVYYLIEVKPGTFDITIHRKWRGTSGTFKVAMPWQYFLFSWERVNENEWGIKYYINRSFVLWSKKRITSLNDPCGIARLPNVYGDANGICFGGVYSKVVDHIQRMDDLVNSFYGSKFNDDLGLRVPYKSMEVWQEKTEQNPFCWMGWRFSTVTLAQRLGL